MLTHCKVDILKKHCYSCICTEKKLDISLKSLKEGDNFEYFHEDFFCRNLLSCYLPYRILLMVLLLSLICEADLEKNVQKVWNLFMK